MFGASKQEYSPKSRLLFWLAAATVIFVAVMACLNEYYREHRTAYVFNAFGPNAKVVIDGNVQVPANEQSVVSLAEGKHHVDVTGLVNESYDVDLHSDYLQRWTFDPLWVINIGGATQLVEQTHHYAQNNPAPTEATLTAGDLLFFAPHVDYRFVNAPNSLMLDSSSSQVTKQQVSIGHEQVDDVFGYLRAHQTDDAALRFAESWLLINPADRKLLEDYFRAVKKGSNQERGQEFLKRQLSRRPVLVNWHRYYQEMHRKASEQAGLLKEYDALLDADPNNAALIYLRGRLSSSISEGLGYYKRAIAADPQLPWPWIALCYEAATAGDWARCKQFAEEASQRGSAEDVEPYKFLARLGLGEQAALEREYRDKLALEKPGEDFTAVAFLTSLLVARGDVVSAKHVVDEWANKLPADNRPTELLEQYGGTLEYMAGDLNAVGQRVAAGTADSELKMLWLLSTNKPDEVANDKSFAQLLEEPWNMLAVSVVYELNGQHGQSSAWRARAADTLSLLGQEEIAAEKLLLADTPPTKQQLDELGLDPNDKSLLLAVLALQFPAQRDELAGMARKLAILPGGFSQLVRAVNDRKAATEQ
jgi:hypothetical protein